MQRQSKSTPTVSLQYVGIKLKDLIVKYLHSNSSNHLVVACVLGKEATICELKPKAQEINCGEPKLYGMAPLHLACLFGHQEVVNTLLEYGADVNLRVENTVAKETPIHIAAGNGYGEIVKGLLIKGADPNTIASNHLKTPLHVAVSEGHLDVVKSLLLGGAVTDVSRPTTLSKFASWCSPLHIACRKGLLEIIKVLIQHGAKIDAKTEDPRAVSALHESVSSNQIDAVKYLIERGVKLDIFDISGFSPLHAAAKHGYTDVMDLLLKAGMTADLYCVDPIHTPLVTSIISGQYSSVKTLLEAGSKVDGVLNDGAPLHQAIRLEPTNLPIIELLVSFGANEHVSDEIGYFPLHCAAYYGQYEIVDFFLQRGHNQNQLSECPDDIGQCETALHCAIYGDNPDVVRLLVKAGVCVNSQAQPGKQTPIYHAVLNRKIGMVDQLISLGADVNFKDASHATPLHHAICGQNNEIVRMLIQNGAFLEAKTLCDDLTPLHIATIDGTDDSVMLLIDLGASVNESSAHGETSLHFAAELNFVQKAETLLQNGADVNSSDCNGTTPLHLASGKGYDALVKLLCKQEEVKIDVVDCDGITPLHLAAFNGHKTVVQILLDAGADHNMTCNGESICNICCRRGSTDVTQLLSGFQATTQSVKNSEQTHSVTLPRYLMTVLDTDGIGRSPPSNQARHIICVVTAFIKDLMKAVGEADPRFACEVTLSGSNAESCKVGEPNEFDFMFYLPSLAENFAPSYTPDDTPGYCKVEFKKGKDSELVRDLLKDGKYLFPQRIKACLFSLIEDVFLSKRVKVPQEIRFYLQEFLPNSSKHRIVSEIKPGFILHFEWRRGLYTGMQITADVIPTLPFAYHNEVSLNYTTQSRDVLSGMENSGAALEASLSTLYLIPTPISRHATHSFENVVWRISTSKLETKILRGVAECKRNTYILGKVLLQRSGQVPDTDGLGSCAYYVHTYLLKTAFLYELARVPADEEWETGNAVTRLLQIFELLKKNIKSGCVNSFFFKEYNLVVTENTVTEINARIWIIDAILLFLSGKYDLQLEQNEPRSLEKMLQDQRPGSISTREVNKSQRQELSSS